MGFLLHRVGRDEIVAGDHIYTWRNAYAYSHHGVYIGENMVVHLTSGGIFSASSSKIALSSFNFSASCSKNLPGCPIMPDSSSKIEVPTLTASCSQNLPACLECGFRKSESGVLLSCLDCFLAGGSLHRFVYGVRSLVFLVKRGGTCTTAKSDAPEVVIRRAKYLLHNGFGNYSVLDNNCEDFALYCKTSLLIQGQGAPGRSGQVSGIIRSPELLILIPIGMTTAGITWRRYASDIGVRSDVVKVEVEDVASFRCS